jgi:hypothetical protein
MKVYVGARTRAGACERAVIAGEAEGLVERVPTYPNVVMGNRLYEVDLRAKLYRPKNERAKRRKKA